MIYDGVSCEEGESRRMSARRRGGVGGAIGSVDDCMDVTCGAEAGVREAHHQPVPTKRGEST
jgi:hypothetical protein